MNELSPDKMSLRQLKNEVLSLSTDIHRDLSDKDELADRLNRMIRTIEVMKEERLNKIKSLPNSLHGSPQQRQKVSQRMATSTIVSRTQQPQDDASTPSVLEMETTKEITQATKRVLFSPDSDDDSPKKQPVSYLPSPDPPPMRSPSVTRNPLYDSPDPFLTSEPGSDMPARESLQVQSLAGMIPLSLDLSSATVGENKRAEASFSWPLDSQPNDWMVKILLELKDAVSSLQDSQTQIMRALDKPPPSPFSLANDSRKGVHFHSAYGEDDQGGRPERALGTATLKSSRSFRIRHDSKGAQRKEIETPSLSRINSLIESHKSNGSDAVQLIHSAGQLIHPASNEEKLKMEQAASVIQRHFRHFQAKRKGLPSVKVVQQLQKVQVIAQMINLTEEAKGHTSNVVEERTGMARRILMRNDESLASSSASNADLWSKARLRIERLRREGSAAGMDSDLPQPSFVNDLRVESSLYPSDSGSGLPHGGSKGKQTHPVPPKASHPVARYVYRLICSSLSALLALLANLHTALKPITNPLKAWLQLQHQKLSNSADVRVRALVLVAISFTLVSIGALAYHLTTGASWTSSFFYVYSILFNVPGTDLTVEHSIPGLVLTNCIFLVGVLVFAVLLGMIGEEVANQIVLLRSGTGPLRLSGHILVLNSNMELVPLLEQIQAAGMCRGHIFSGRSIVILADEPKEELERKKGQCLTYIESKRGSKGVMDIHTRSGKPYSFDDLALVSAQTASFIVLLYPPISSSNSSESEGITTSQRLRMSDQADLDESKAESLKAATVAAMATLGRSKDQNLVVQVPLEVKPEHSQLEVVNDLLKKEGADVSVCRIPEVKVIDRLISQTALQPGVMTVLRKILRQGNNFSFQYINVDKHLIEMMGRAEAVPYSEMRRKFGNGCVIIGYCRMGPEVHLLPPASGSLNQRTRLNPEEDEELKVGDLMIGIVATDTIPVPLDDNLPAMHEASRRAIQRLAKVREDII